MTHNKTVNKQQRIIRLADVCEFIVDCPHSTDNDEATGYPLIRTPNVGKGRLLLDGVFRVSDEVYNKRNQRGIPQDNDLIFAREAPAGNVAIIKSGEKVCLGQRTVLIRPDKSKVYPDFLVYYLLSPTIQSKLLGPANGSTVTHVNLPVIRKLKVNLPEMRIQKQIGDTLCSYDDLIENNKQRISLLEKATQQLYKEWFISLRYPSSKKHGRHLDTVTGWCINGKEEYSIPDGWKFGNLDELGLFKRGKNITISQAIDGNVPVISAGIQPSCYHNCANVKGHSLTISSSGANAGYLQYHLNDIWAADCSYYQSDENIWFVYNSIKFLQKVIDNMQIGAAQPHVYPKHINKLQILLPDIKTISEYNKIVSAYYEEINLLQNKNQNLIKQRDLLLPRLLSGKLEVK